MSMRQSYRSGIIASLALLLALPLTAAYAVTIEVFHADSLGGPMRELKRVYEGQHPGLTLNLVSGVSRQLAARILKGDACDVFTPSSPAVIDEDLMHKKIASTGED